MSRSLKKGPYIDFKLEKKVDKLNDANKKEVIKRILFALLSKFT